MRSQLRLVRSSLLGAFLGLLIPLGQIHAQEIPTVTRLGDGPIIVQHMDGIPAHRTSADGREGSSK